LPPEAQVKRRLFRVGTKRIDIDTTAPLVACVNRQVLARTSLQNLDKHALDTRLVKIVVLAE